MAEKRKYDPELEAKKELLTPEARCSHPHLFTPSAIKKGATPQYSIELLFDKTTTKIADLQRPCIEAMKQMWGPTKEDWPNPRKMPYRDGDVPYGKKKEVKPEHAGMWVVKASTNASEKFGGPHVVGKNAKVALTKESDVYPGCYVRAAVKAYAYEAMSEDGKPGVKFILNGVQFIRDGAALGGGRKAADQIFGNLEGADEDTSFDDFGGEESFDSAEV